MTFCKASMLLSKTFPFFFQMLLYTSLTYDVFLILAKTLDRFQLQYYMGWKVNNISPESQLLLHSRLPEGVNLNIPPFLRSKSHFTKEEAELCFKRCRARIHVERANERIKNFEILSHIPAHLCPLSTKIFQVCCFLVNFQAPLIKEIVDNYEMLNGSSS